VLSGLIRNSFASPVPGEVAEKTLKPVLLHVPATRSTLLANAD
jgi:hypothetical protein